jgi:polysaccharide pyruvyl transferase WcaK-like protein
MKVGVLTFHGVANYGATMQAYALFIILEKLGHDVELINYSSVRSFVSTQKYLYLNSNFVVNVVKQWRMNKFFKKRVKLNAKKCFTNKDLKKHTRKYNAIICGSDEIWNIHLPIQNFDFNYFLEFVNQDIPKISYGTSFGYTSSENIGTNLLRISQSLKSFCAISVRDENSLKLVNSFQVSGVKVLDPTFLCQYSKILSPPTVKRKYLLVYGHLSSVEQIFAKKIAKYYDLDTIAIGYHCQLANQNYLSVSPSEWLGYFANASYVISDFYHGVIFSIIFNKAFSVFVREAKFNKIASLLKDLSIENRIIHTNDIKLYLEKLADEKPIDLMNIDFDYQKLNLMIKESQQYLDNALISNTKDIA